MTSTPAPLSFVLGHPGSAVELEARVWIEPSGRVALAAAVAPARKLAELRAGEATPLRSVILSQPVGASLLAWLEHFDLAAEPERGSPDDGLWARIVAPSGRRFLLAPLAGAALEAIALVVTALRWQSVLVGRSDRALAPLIEAATSEHDRARRLARPDAHLDGAVFRARSLGIDELVLSRDARGVRVIQGDRELPLPVEAAEAVLAGIDELARTRSTRLGGGECLFELERAEARIEVRCPVAGGIPSIDRAPLAARAALEALLGLAGALAEDDDALRQRDLDAWRARLPRVARAVRTRDLLLRFRMNDARYGQPGERWYRLETHGTIVRCDAGQTDDEGRPIVPHEVPEDLFETILAQLEAVEALSLRERDLPYDAWPDDDRLIELILQRPTRDARLETSVSRWAWGPMAPSDRHPDSRRALDAIYALYQSLMKARQPADVS
jgi:hypothetical protein